MFIEKYRLGRKKYDSMQFTFRSISVCNLGAVYDTCLFGKILCIIIVCDRKLGIKHTNYAKCRQLVKTVTCNLFAESQATVG